MMRCLRPSPKANILPGTSGGSSFTKRFGMPMAARADFSEKYLTPESGLPKAHNLSSVLAFSNGQSPGCRPGGLQYVTRLEFCTFTPALSPILQRVGVFFECVHPERGR